jgi:hypothetical protein
VAVYPLSYGYYPVSASPAFPQGRLAPRPILKLTLVNGEKNFTCYTIIDSGADHCVFPRAFMQPLGLDPLVTPIEMSSGVGTTAVPTHFVNLNFDVQGLFQFSAYAGFTTGLDPLGVGLLGQLGFFDRFNVEFRLGEKKCFIEVPDPPAASK